MASGNLADLAHALDGKKEGISYRCRCPSCAGGNLWLSERDGKLLLKCWQGCEQNAVLDALREQGLWGGGYEDVGPMPAEVLEAEYDYGPAIKGRFRTFGGKTFRWRRKDDSEWGGLRGLKECDLPLYRAAELANDSPVFLVEGEKAADACWAVGLPAACCPGGASAKDFGQQLAPLGGRDVILWPDNDDAGRLLMRRLDRALLPLAATVATIAPDVPEHGDAYDYFERGGTAEHLAALATARPKGPWIREIPDGYEICIPDAGGHVSFQFDGFQRRGVGLTASLRVAQHVPGVTEEWVSGPLNFSSGGARTDFRRTLDEAFGKELGWTLKLSRACEMALSAYEWRDSSVVLADVEELEASYLIHPFIEADGPSILFGQGASGKTYLALAMAAALSLGLSFLGTTLSQRAVLYVDYEASASRLKHRLRLLLAGMGMEDSVPALIYWPAEGRPIHEMAKPLRRLVQEHDIGLVIVDSAALACGGDAEKQEAASRYMNMLASLRCPSLTLAHITKDGSDRFPFGSIFWSNSARLTWNVKLTHAADGHCNLGLFNRKANEDREHKPIGVRLIFGENLVQVQRADLSADWDEERPLPQRLWSLLLTGRKSVRELHLTTGKAESTIRGRLSEMRQAQAAGLAPDGTQYWEAISDRSDAIG